MLHLKPSLIAILMASAVTVTPLNAATPDNMLVVAQNIDDIVL